MKLLLIFLVCLVVVLGYYGFSFYQKFSAAQKLIAEAEPFEINNTEGEGKMLVLGDSTAVGVGAEAPEDTVPARLSKHLNLQAVENQAVSGARAADIKSQIDRSRETEYQYVLVMIGANDVIRFGSAKPAAETLKESLADLPKHSKLIVMLSAGNVGGAQFFPWFIRPFHTRLNQEYHREFSLVVEEAGGSYINLYEDPKNDPFVNSPEIYLASDGLHPTSAGYEIWFSKMLEQAGLK